MNVFVNGNQINDYVLQVEPLMTIKDVKNWVRESFPNLISINLTFSDGQRLADIVFQTEQYDLVNFTQYAPVIAGGRIDVSMPGPPVGALQSPVMSRVGNTVHMGNRDTNTVHMLIAMDRQLGPRSQRAVYASTNINIVINYWMDHYGNPDVNELLRQEGIFRSNNYTENYKNRIMEFMEFEHIYSTELH